MVKPKKPRVKNFSENRRARFDYSIIDEYTAGIVLYGYEAKSVRAGNSQLKGSFVTIKGNEAWLTNAHIGRYKHATTITEHDDLRPRKLLLSKRELNNLFSAKNEGLTIIPLSLYAAHGLIKLKIATARGKKKYDKRQTIKKRDTQRDSDRLIKKMKS
jgi:SsrA-binding protein